jgi:uncharacterized protein YbbC (DUF1343 family)
MLARNVRDVAGTVLAALALAATLTGPPSTSPAPAAQAERHRGGLTLGIDTLIDRHLDWLEGKRVGLITNPTGVDRQLRHGIDRLIALEDEGGFELTALYGPEHGVRGGATAGEYVESYIDERTGLPVYSLYGPTRQPTPEMLADVDVLLFHIQDVGVRFYTYIWTMYYAMEAAAANGKQFIVLDRPNPLGADVAGPILDPALSSFVGLREIPVQHGMTVGELARLFNGEFFDGAVDLRVAEMRGYRPDDRERTEFWNLPWVLPSPNIPTLDAAWVYPGTGLVESVNVSEGRGTTKPFEWVGAPWIDDTGAQDLADDLNGRGLPGVTFRPMFATPTTSKHQGAFSGGVQLHVTDPAKFEPLRTGLHVLDALFVFEETDWREGADCRTATDICWIDRLTGDRSVRLQMDAGVAVDDIVAGWRDDEAAFARLAAPYRLYPVAGRGRPGSAGSAAAEGSSEAT